MLATIMLMKLRSYENRIPMSYITLTGTNHHLVEKSGPTVPKQIMPRAHMRHRQMANSCLQIASISAPCRDLRLQFPLSTLDEKE